MEEKPFKALAKSSGHRGSGKSSPHDIRNLWTTATQSQPKLNVALPTVREDSELEGSSVGGKTRWSYNQKAGHDSDGGWEESDDGEDKDSFKPEELDEHALMELEMRRGSSLGGSLEEDDSKTDDENASSVSSLSISKHTPHRAYWVEQQSRLPLPLTELMENEALEILTKALRSYRSEIGRDHFLTKQLQRYIEGLKRRRNKRLQVMPLRVSSGHVLSAAAYASKYAAAARRRLGEAFMKAGPLASPVPP
ncbi:cation channel sperm-associated protein subunit zeta [Phocoena sinus]|uniref:cation channel sperm-associated protein subunit zeta n=1 Tax=Phocoena sinus TaxID=42100 RepID=UPI0013C4C0E6|nr:cation channel sperm-associated protein subunit zeta [Phocoena sinus]